MQRSFVRICVVVVGVTAVPLDARPAAEWKNLGNGVRFWQSEREER